MAKAEDADPRWIVEDRPDAINVNNWHWTEKNASQWSKNKLKELLMNLQVDEPGLGVCHIKELPSIEGEAFANNRKAKLIFFYEWNIKGNWEGFLNGKDTIVTGHLEIPNLSEENDIDEIDVQINVEKGSDTVEGDILKEMMRNKGTELIKEKLNLYIKELKEDFAKDLILPTKNSKASGETNIKHSGKSQIVSSSRSNGINYFEKTSSESDNKMKSLKLVENLKCRAHEFYNTLTIPELCSAFTRNNVEIDVTPDGKFNLFDGNVSGIFVSLEPNKMIKQKWRFKIWPEGHYSDVTITIDEKEDSTQVIIEQKGIPEFDLERTETGWKLYYFESIKRTFGFGAALTSDIY